MARFHPAAEVEQTKTIRGELLAVSFTPWVLTPYSCYAPMHIADPFRIVAGDFVCDLHAPEIGVQDGTVLYFGQQLRPPDPQGPPPNSVFQNLVGGHNAALS